MVRFVVLAIGAAWVSGCIARDQLVCAEDAQCSLERDGVCVDGACAYPDDGCPSGLRYSGLAGEDAGRCVETDGGADDSTTAAITTSDADTTPATTSSSTTSDEDTGPIPEGCDGVTCSDAGTCVLVDDEPTCACDAGLWMLGLECVLDPCTEVVCRYVDDVSGDDANDGSADAPWRTLTRLSQAFADAVPGDHFLLRRGGVWGDADSTFRLNISGADGSFDEPIVIGAYGPLADGPPRLAPGHLRVNASAHVVVRDLLIEDDPDSQEIFDLFGNRPCVLVQDSQHVVVLDNDISNCNTRGVWVAYGSTYTSIVGNSVRDTGNDGISITDITWIEPIDRVGPHHWVVDNLVEGAGNDGIIVDIGSLEVELGDAKIAGNIVADAAARGIGASTSGYVWLVDNVVARAGGISSWQGALTMAARGEGQLSGNIVFDTLGNGLTVQHVARVSGNTVIHDGIVGEALVVDDAAQMSATRNLLWARDGRDTVRVLAGAASDHVVALDQNWYGGVDEAACVFRDGLDVYDLPAWRAATRFDLVSMCAPVPGFGAFADALPVSAWDDELWAAFVPGGSWAGCLDPVGARDCDGAPIGPEIGPLTGLDESDGLGWKGPLLVQQRYDAAP